MKKYLIISVLVFLINMPGFGQAPNWKVEENNYQFTMSFVSFLNIDGTTLTSSNDKIAAFVNQECRGVANLTYVESEKSHYAFLTVFSNNNGETLKFKIYNSATDEITDVLRSKSFEIDKHYGDLFQSFSFANPALRADAEILDFTFKNENLNDLVISDGQVTLLFDKDADLSKTNSVFELSPGAKLFMNSTEITSGENSIDFTNPIQFNVLSEDRSVLKAWNVLVNLSYGTATFYKKDAVCYAGGVIKVEFTENGEDVLLIRNGITLATKSIINGEAIFSNLETGTYKVRVGGNVKNVSINVKQ